ncbi:MAG: hypothetical protein LUH19_07910 [Lachnospiraceae bacterium]|nr:hypothetical protein [Lachnospiraceae bacterium]
MSLQAPASGTDGVIKAAKGLEVVSVDETHEDLEEYFMSTIQSSSNSGT